MAKLSPKAKLKEVSPTDITPVERALGIASYTVVCIAIGFMMGKNKHTKQFDLIEQKLGDLEQKLSGMQKEPEAGSFWERMEFKQTIQNQKLSKIEREVNKFLGDSKYKQEQFLRKQDDLLKELKAQVSKQEKSLEKFEKLGKREPASTSKRVTYPSYNSKKKRERVKYFFGDAIKDRN